MRTIGSLYKEVSATVVGGVALALPTIVSAQAPTVTPLTPAAGTGATFGGLVRTILNVVLIIASVAAILYLLISGFNYITAGGDDEKAAGARKGIVNAIIGIIVIVAAWFIYNAAANAGKTIGSGGSTGARITL